MIRAWLLSLCTLVAISCSRPVDAPKLTELQRVKSGDLEVVLLAGADALKQNKDMATLEFRTGADHHLVDVGTVKVDATMSMAGMAPMIGSAEVARGDAAGRYTVTTDLGMAGTWRLTVTWDGPAGRGTASLPGTVR